MTERDLLAAEHALRVLEGEEQLEALRLVATDPGFAAEVAAWDERLAPLYDEIAPVDPGPELWLRIEQALARPRGEVVLLRSRVRRWQGLAAAASVLAAAMTGLFAYQLGRERTPSATVQPEPAPVLIAAMASDDTRTSLSAAFSEGSLTVTAGRIEPATNRDHQLWIIPADGTPRPLAILRGGEPQRIVVSTELRPHFRQAATLAVSVEPVGGSPTGLPTGQVVAAGTLQPI